MWGGTSIRADYAVHETVVLHGLTKKPELNGQRGTVETSPQYSHSGDADPRFTVKLEKSRQLVRVRASNLKEVVVVKMRAPTGRGDAVGSSSASGSGAEGASAPSSLRQRDGGEKTDLGERDNEQRSAARSSDAGNGEPESHEGTVLTPSITRTQKILWAASVFVALLAMYCATSTKGQTPTLGDDDDWTATTSTDGKKSAGTAGTASASTPHASTTGSSSTSGDFLAQVSGNYDSLLPSALRAKVLGLQFEKWLWIGLGIWLCYHARLHEQVHRLSPWQLLVLVQMVIQFLFNRRFLPGLPGFFHWRGNLPFFGGGRNNVQFLFLR
eukprot:g247.t1